MTGIFLARHGETPYNAEGRFQGHLPVGLTAKGIEQARALAEVAAQHAWASFWCSPLERARLTAEIVGAAIGMQPRVDERFAETDCGDWTDRPFAEVVESDPEGFQAFLRADPAFRFPGGESFAEQQQRVAAALADVRATGELPALVVCHRGVIRVAVVATTGDETKRGLVVDNASLVEL